MMNLFQSIKGKFLIFALCISLIPITVVTTIYYLHAGSTLKRQTLEELGKIAEAKRIHVLSFMEKLKIRTLDFSTDGFIRNTIEKIIMRGDAQQGTVKRLNRYLLKHKKSTYHHLRAIIITDNDGRIVSSTQENLVGNTIFDNGVQIKVFGKKFGEICVCQPRYYPYLDANCIFVSAPLTSLHNADSLGVIINAYSLSALNEIMLDRIGMGETGEIYLVNRDKIMLTESRFIGDAPLKQVIDTEPVRNIIENGKEMIGIYKDYRGVPVAGASMVIPNYHWILLAEIDKTEIFMLLKGLGTVTLILGIISSGVVTILGIVFIISIVKPIENLKNATMQLAKGNLEYRVKVIGKDEISDLANSFNVMADDLAREITEHKNAKEALKESEQKFRAIFDHATDGILLADMDTKQLFMSNKAICRMLGYSHDEIRNLRVMDIHPREYLPSIIERFEKQSKREITLAAGIPVKRKDGSIFCADVNAACITFGGKTYLVGIFRDVTERKRIDDELKEFNKILEQCVAERTLLLEKANKELRTEIIERRKVEKRLRKYELLFSEISDLAYICDTGGNILFVNKAFERLTSHKPEEFVGRSFAPLFDEENLKKAMYFYKRTLEGESSQFELYFKDTEILCEYKGLPLLDEDGNITGVIGTARDITDRKRAEEMLEKSRDALLNAQRIAHLGNWEWDVIKNEVLGSDEFYRIFGLEPQKLQEFAGTYESFLRFVHPDDKEFVDKTVHEALYKKKPFNIDSRIVLGNGLERTVHAQAEVTFDDTGKAVQMRGIAQDITELKRLEDELRKISNAVEQSSGLIVIADAKGSIEYVNPKFTQVTGYTLEEVIGKNPRILKSGKTQPEVYKKLWATITSGGEWRGEFLNKKKNGELYWDETSISPIRNSRGIITHFTAVKEDITKRKQMEEELRILNRSLEKRIAERTAELVKVNEELKSEIVERKQVENALRKNERSLANAQRIAHIGNWEWNIINNELRWSNEIYHIFGLIPQMFGATYEAFLNSVHPDDREFVKRSVSAALYERKPYSIDHRITLPDSSVRFVHEEAEVIFDDTERPIQMNGTVHDITERKQAEEAIRLSEAKYRLLLENLPQRIFYKDRNSTYISCNENLARDFHIKPEEIAGKTDYDFVPKELADKYRADDKSVIESGQTMDREEKYIKNGQELIVHTVKTPVRNEKGDVIGILGVFWDITEKVALQMEAIRNRHLVALGELAAGVGHEINNPMTGIINCAQILSNKSKEGSTEKDIANRIINEGNRVANIVHSLLSFAMSGKRKGKKSIVGVDDILLDTFILTDAQLREEGIKVKLNIPQKLSKIVAYPQQIQQVFLNIISNARYALNQKYPETHDNKILEVLGEVIIMDNNPYIKVTFYDHGTGIPANIIDKVLDPFFTTKSRHKGTGLGLSISHSIIKNHGGKILIDSVEGEYTKIIITLPVKGYSEDDITS